MEKVKVNKQFSLQGWDYIKGAIIAVVSSVLTVVVQSLDAGVLEFDWLTIRAVALSALVAYLLKNYVEPTKVVIEAPQESTVREAEQARVRVR